MALGAPSLSMSQRRAYIPYIAPFLVFVATSVAEREFSIPLQVGYPLRVLLTLLMLLLVSRCEVKLMPVLWLGSIGLGLVVFAIWIAPDALIGYRHFWLFENSIMGEAVGSLSPQLQRNWPFLLIRAMGSTLLVPVIEELFWRGWLMRWLIDRDFEKIPLGTYAPGAFWLTAAVYASEHGPYWEVALVAGVLYGWWMIHTKSLADCILAHAVTNGALAGYVVASGAWRYWL